MGVGIISDVAYPCRAHPQRVVLFAVECAVVAPGIRVGPHILPGRTSVSGSFQHASIVV